MQPLDSNEVERALLGAMLVAGVFDQDVLLSADDFFSKAHGLIYRTMEQMREAERRIDVATLADALKRKDELERVGGVSYIAGLTDGAPWGPGSERALRDYERLIRQAAVRRRLSTAASNLAARAGASDVDFETLQHEIDCLKSLLNGIDAGWTDDSIQALEREYQEFVQQIERLSIRSGIAELDERTGGFLPGEVVTFIARTGVGKSAIVQNIIDYVLTQYPCAGVAFFSLEMPRVQVFERQLQIHTGKERSEVIDAYRGGNRAAVGADEFMAKATGRLYINDRPGLSLPQIESIVRGHVALKSLLPVQLLVIDYLGYLSGGAKNASLVERISEIARDIKALAKRLGCVVLVITQTSRKAGDGSEEVTLLDARDSGAIEESADFMIGCWRPELAGGLGGEALLDVLGELWFKILKGRRGLQHKFCAVFKGETLQVLSLEKAVSSSPDEATPGGESGGLTPG